MKTSKIPIFSLIMADDEVCNEVSRKKPIQTSHHISTSIFEVLIIGIG